MPNGGVPIDMTLRPREGGIVLHTHKGQLRVFTREEWETQGPAGTPLTVLSDDEGAALAWQLRYWLGEQRLRPGYNMRSRVDADYDS